VPSIEQLLREKFIPWSDNACERIIVAGKTMRSSLLPDDVRLEKRPLIGKRVIVKNGRLYHNTRVISARWPDCGLNEVKLFKLAIVLSGNIDFQLGNQAVLCGPGHFIFIPPNVPHPDGTRNISDVSKSPCSEVTFFNLYPNAVQCWVNRCEPNLPLPRQFENYLLTQEHIIKLFQILMEETTSNSPTDLKPTEKLLQSFFHLLLREISAGHFHEIPQGHEILRENDNKSPLPNLEKPGEFSEYLHQYIQSHLYDRPTLDKAAQNTFLSRAQFSRYVKANTGQTFIQILNAYRMERAKELLRDSDWTISSIATFIGYRTPHHFQNLFREKTGMTPNTYRKQVKKVETKS
jgi:AraC-like DNA-binding protein